MHPALLRALALFLTLITLAHAQISKCPKAENTYIAGDNLFTVCPGSDYKGTTTEAIKNVGSAIDCLYLCAARPACKKAVFEPGANKCHIKTSTGTLTWVASTQYDSIRLSGKAPPREPQEGDQVDHCTVEETEWVNPLNGKKYMICPGHDFRWEDTLYVTNMVSIEDCAYLCSAASACTRAVFESAKSWCHIKKAAPGGKTVWTIGQAFDAIRQV